MGGLLFQQSSKEKKKWSSSAGLSGAAGLCPGWTSISGASLPKLLGKQSRGPFGDGGGDTSRADPLAALATPGQGPQEEPGAPAAQREGLLSPAGLQAHGTESVHVFLAVNRNTGRSFGPVVCLDPLWQCFWQKAPLPKARFESGWIGAGEEPSCHVTEWQNARHLSLALFRLVKERGIPCGAFAFISQSETMKPPPSSSVGVPLASHLQEEVSPSRGEGQARNPGPLPFDLGSRNRIREARQCCPPPTPTPSSKESHLVPSDAPSLLQGHLSGSPPRLNPLPA